MSRRILAPALLLFAALASMAAVFGVHQIESGGGPLAEPYVSPTVAPGVKAARIRFTAQHREHVTVRVVDEDGRVMATPRRDRLERGGEPGTIFEWDGTDDHGHPLPDGSYRVELQRRGDRRTYSTSNLVRVDTHPPVAKLDAVSVVDGQLRGLVLLDPSDDAQLGAYDEDGDKIRTFRASRPSSDTVTVTPRDRWPAHTVLVRFTVPLDGRDPKDVHLAVVDLAGNRTVLGE
ncbi:MAG: FlgD Ig-like domain [Thermoleophilia bacterium]|nr:FlgD Ig-like domain [Thermoleophilia bacterium]